jgi:hypothetical protein
MVCSCKHRTGFLGVVEAAGIGCCHNIFGVDSIYSFVGHVRARATCLWAQVASVNSLVKRFQYDDALIDAHAGLVTSAVVISLLFQPRKRPLKAALQVKALASQIDVGEAVVTVGVLVVGAVVLRVGTLVLAVGTFVFNVGEAVLVVGAPVLMVGFDVFTVGTLVLVVGVPVLVVGANVFTVGTF